jgi:hypothetical protein
VAALKPSKHVTQQLLMAPESALTGQGAAGRAGSRLGSGRPAAPASRAPGRAPLAELQNSRVPVATGVVIKRPAHSCLVGCPVAITHILVTRSAS